MSCILQGMLMFDVDVAKPSFKALVVFDIEQNQDFSFITDHFCSYV